MSDLYTPQEPPEGRLLTEFVVHLVEIGEELGLPTMLEYPDVWMDTLDAMLRGLCAADIVALKGWGVDKTALGKRLKRRGLPGLVELRALATVGLYVWHQEHEPGTCQEVAFRMGQESYSTLHGQARRILGEDLGALRTWTVRDVVARWAERTGRLERREVA